MDPDIVIPVPRKRRFVLREQAAPEWIVVPSDAELHSAGTNRPSAPPHLPKSDQQAQAFETKHRLSSLASLASDLKSKPPRRDSFGNPLIQVTNNKISWMAGKQESLLESRKFSFEAASATGQDESICETVELERIYSVFKSGKTLSWVDDFRLLLDRLDLNESEIEEWKENQIGKNELFCTLWFEFNKRLGKSPIAPGKLGRKGSKAKPAQEPLAKQPGSELRPAEPQHRPSLAPASSLAHKNFIHVSESWSRIESNQTVEECDENYSMELPNEKPEQPGAPGPSQPNPDASEQPLLGKRALEEQDAVHEVAPPHQTLSQAICRVFQCELPYYFPTPEERARRGSFDLLSPTDKSLKGTLP